MKRWGCLWRSCSPRSGTSTSPSDETTLQHRMDKGFCSTECGSWVKRYHELVDKQMCEDLSALEKEELDTIKMRIDESDESNEMLQQAEAHMDAKRRLFDEQLEKISRQLKALLEQI